ncbi:MAG: thiamine diphosphokinase [Ardenticatenaceae bacterium]|nr:thiamine diphosphokinase [Ardenticatenaceae bacterium]
MALLIFANGVVDEVEWIRPYLAQATAVWAADGGSQHLKRLGHLPDRVIGDMDSLPPEVRSWLAEASVPFNQHPPEKDETDLELALLLAVEQGYDEIWLFGLLGGRLDQALANVLLLTHPALTSAIVKLFTPTEQAWLVHDQTKIVGLVGDVVSLIPLRGDVKMVRTTGLQWPLTNETLQFGLARGVSNRMTAVSATVEISRGILLCVHTAVDGQTAG